MNETEQKLEEETKKWRDRLDGKLEGLDESQKEVEQMENVLAYREDTDHFLEENDYIRAWESIIYAWGIFETLERLGKIED